MNRLSAPANVRVPARRQLGFKRHVDDDPVCSEVGSQCQEAVEVGAYFLRHHRRAGDVYGEGRIDRVHVAHAKGLLECVEIAPVPPGIADDVEQCTVEVSL